VKPAVAMLLVLAAGPTHAQSVLVHGPSYHSNGATNARTFGLGYAFGNGFSVGAYRNSEGSTSVYGSWTWTLLPYLDLHAVLATGYSRGPLAPGVLLDLNVPIADMWRVHLMAAPTYDSDRVGIMLHAAVSLRL